MEVTTGSCGELEGVVKVLTDFSEATEMVFGKISGVYQALLYVQVISSMLMGGIFTADLTP